jgi:nitrate/nitrite transporter NarK
MPSLGTLVLIGFAIFIAISAVLRLEPRIAMRMAIVLLVAAALTLALGKEDLAEQLALYAYYFLASGAILLLVQKTCGKPKKEDKESQR